MDGRRERGMVTVELAVGLLAAGLAVAAVSWLMAVLVAQAQIFNTATEVARQVARGDEAAVERARDDALEGAVVTDEIVDGAVRVEVRYDANPLGPRFLTVPLVATATVEAEP